jgi:hypothetical protein
VDSVSCFLEVERMTSATPSKDAAARLIGALAVLIPIPNCKAARAAAHLVCQEVIKANPLASPDVVDLDTAAWR